MLPFPIGRGAERAAETAFEDAIARAGELTADLVRRTLITITSSLTALGNQANLLFIQLAAALALDRMARQAGSYAGMGQAAFAPFFPPAIWTARLWASPFQVPSPAAVPAWPVNLWANPLPALTEAFTAWANIWAPSMPQRPPMSNASGEKQPLTTTFAMPGFSWSVTLG
jgi:hypothetical protein